MFRSGMLCGTSLTPPNRSCFHETLLIISSENCFAPGAGLLAETSSLSQAKINYLAKELTLCSVYHRNNYCHVASLGCAIAHSLVDG